MNDQAGRPGPGPAARMRYAVLGLITGGLWLWGGGDPLWLHTLRMLAIVLVVPALASQLNAAVAQRHGKQRTETISIGRLVAIKAGLVIVALAVTALLGSRVAHLDRYVAAWLAKEVDSQKFGEEIEDYVRFNAPKPKSVDKNRLRGVVLKVDRFGNLITNITPQDAPVLFGAEAKGFKIVVGSREITEIRNAYAEGAPGEVIAILGSMGFLEIAANRGAAAQLTGAGKGNEVSIILGGASAAGKGA